MVAACAVIGVLAAAPVAAAAQVIHATEGQPYQGTVLLSGCPTTASPTINWGDGASTAGSVGAGGSVNGRHTYAEEGSYPGTVTGCGSGPEQFTADVADAPLPHTRAELVNIEAGQFVTNALLGFFVDANMNAPSSDFSGTIVWGQYGTGYRTTATVDPMGAGVFAVYGSAPLPYNSAGLFPVSIYIHDIGGSNVTFDTVVNVNHLPPGPPGVTGAPGASGKAGKLELIRCTTLAKKVKRRVRRLTKCTTGRVVSGTGKLRVAAAIPHATVSRGRRVYATGASVPVGHKRTELVVNDLRPLHRGRYTLTVRARHKCRSVVTRKKITIT